MRKMNLAIKRCVDFLGSLIGLIVVSPFLAITAILIKATSKGPVFFLQDRLGKDGQTFRIIKFRTMVEDAEKKGDGLFVYGTDDNRITRVGKILRKTSLDEIPQLINVVKGDMSIVGPRPLPVYEEEQCTPYQNQRLLMKPGLTCYWHVNGRNDIGFEEWIEMDLRYIREANLLTDLKLICRTFGAVLSGEGAQ